MGSLLWLVRDIAFACFRLYQLAGPPGDNLGHLGLFPGIHVVGVLDHDGIHAPGAARLAANAALEQFQIRLCPNIPPRADLGGVKIEPPLMMSSFERT
jgi:hypothetical protein